MKNGNVVLVLTIVLTILLLIFMAFNSGCSILQPRANPGDALANLPTTGTEAMFQTLKKANWLYTLSIVGVGAGFFAFLNGSSKGLQFMAACFVVLSLIIGVTKYSAVIAAIAMIGAVCLMVYSTLIKGKALREVVQGVQNMRNSKIEGAAPKPLVDGFLDFTQSKTTKALVKLVKEKL